MNKEIFYRVSSFITTFEQNVTHHSLLEDDYSFPLYPFMSSEEIYNIRKQALDFFNERLGQLEEGKFTIAFATSSELQMNENAAYGLTFSIVEVYENEEEYEWFLAGEEDELIEEGEDEEKRIINEILISNQ